MTISAPVPRRWPISLPAATASSRSCRAAERPLVIVGQGALSRPDGLAVLSAAAQLARDVGAVKDGWNGFSVLHTAASRVGALDLGLVPGEWRPERPGHGAGQRGRALQPRCGRDRDRTRRLRDLPGHPWRPRRAPRRRDPAGRDLYREVRNLREHGRPGAARQPRRLRPRRGPRGLGDPARPVRRAGPPPAVRLAECAAREALCAFPAFRGDRHGPAGGCRRSRPGARQYRRDPRPRGFREPGEGFLPDEPDCPRFRRHGRVLRARPCR